MAEEDLFFSFKIDWAVNAPKKLPTNPTVAFCVLQLFKRQTSFKPGTREAKIGLKKKELPGIVSSFLA